MHISLGAEALFSVHMFRQLRRMALNQWTFFSSLFRSDFGSNVPVYLH
jgi:hypothetical protein